MVEPTPTWGPSNIIESQWSHYAIFGCSIFALGWGAFNALKVSVKRKFSEIGASNTVQGERD